MPRLSRATLTRLRGGRALLRARRWRALADARPAASTDGAVAEEGDEPLRLAARRYLTAVALVALVALVLAVAMLAAADRPSVGSAALALALAAGMTLAGLFPLPFAAKTKLYLDTATLVAAVLLYPPGVAVLVVASGMLLAHLLRHQPREQTIFNTAIAVVQAALGGAVLAAAGWNPDDLRHGGPVALLLVAGLGAGLWLLNIAAVAAMVAFQGGERPRRVVVRWLRETDRVEGLAHLAQVGLGVLVAGIADANSWMVALLLLPAGATYQGLAHHVRLRREAEARLVHQAYHDPLTDLPNRRLLLDRVEQALARAGRRGEPVALLYLDLDRFKHVNDSLGHAAGDQLLGATAQRLRAGARPGDTVARLGGDEFAILLDGLADATEAEAVAAALAAAMEDPFTVGGREAMVTTSIGVAVAHPGQATPADLLRDADVALHRAKERGKARYAVFDAAMGASLRDRAALEADLRRAVGRGELRLVYQPIVELATGRVVGAEALARWDHPTRGELLPGAFVPIAEEAGLVGPLGQWVLDAVCRQGRAWQDALPAPLVLSVNVSADQFRQTDLVEVVAGALRETGLAPDRLQLEITEGAAMGDADEAVSTLRWLKGLGVRLAIDDFGTGYSSLAYLQRFPLDLLKVDRRFVAGLGRNEGDTAIVAAVLGLARTLGLRVVAEGVETREQANRLQALDCELGQGYLFGRPASAEAFEALLGSVSFALPRRA